MSSQILSNMDNSGTSQQYVHDEDYSYSSYEDFSGTGYLQDVLFGFSSKRPRLFLFPQDQTKIDADLFDNSTMNCWTSNFIQNCYENLDSGLGQITKSDTSSGMKTADGDAMSENNDLSSSSYKKSTKGTLYSIDPVFSSGTDEKIKKRVSMKVVYPFAVIKPGGFEGDATLNDINERILMPPTRPVRHPVGDFACKPLVFPDGPGLSGKAVVAFTRIHTRGSGTITIFRTKG